MTSTGKKLTFASLPGLDRPSRKNDFSFLNRYDAGNKITAVYCFVQGNGSILCSANCAVNGVKDFLTFKRPSSWICFKMRTIYKTDESAGLPIYLSLEKARVHHYLYS